MGDFDVTVRPERSRHFLFGGVCLCGEWRAGCGNDIPTQWADHIRATATPTGQPEEVRCGGEEEAT